MAVEVIRMNVGGMETTERYDAGETFEIDEGHLLVRSALKGSDMYGKKLATFAPGSWKFARVVDEG